MPSRPSDYRPGNSRPGDRVADISASSHTTSTASSANLDTYLDESAPTTARGGAEYIVCGWNTTEKFRGVIGVDFPNTKNVVSCVLTLTLKTAPAFSMTMYAHLLALAKVPVEAEATWERWKTAAGGDWTAAGGDIYAADPYASIAVNATDTDGTTKSLDITELAKVASGNGLTSFYVLLTCTENGAQHMSYFYSKEDGTASRRPSFLFVTSPLLANLNAVCGVALTGRTICGRVAA